MKQRFSLEGSRTTRIPNPSSQAPNLPKETLLTNRMTTLEFNSDESFSSLESENLYERERSDSKRKTFLLQRRSHTSHKVLVVPSSLPRSLPGSLPSSRMNRMGPMGPKQNINTENDVFFPILIYSNQEKIRTSTRNFKNLEPGRKTITSLGPFAPRNREGSLEKTPIKPTRTPNRIRVPVVKPINTGPLISERCGTLTDRRIETSNYRVSTIMNTECSNLLTQANEDFTQEVLGQTRRDTLRMNGFNLWKENLQLDGPLNSKPKREKMFRTTSLNLPKFGTIQRKFNGTIDLTSKPIKQKLIVLKV